MKKFKKHFKKHGQKYGLGLLGGLLLALALGGIALFNSQERASAQVTQTIRSWQPVGITGFSMGGIALPSLTLGSNNTPYIAYTDRANNYKATVMRFNGLNWINVGIAGFSTDAAHSLSLKLDSNNTLYVAYNSSSGRGNQVKVMKFDGNNWIAVGTPFSTGYGAFVGSLEINSNNIPYVAFSENSSSKIKVMKFDGNNWILVGTEIFASRAVFLSLKLGVNDIPYIAYVDTSNYSDISNRKIKVMKFDGNNWVPVGSPFSGTPDERIAIALDSNNTPYIAFPDYTNSYKITVKKFDGTNRILVGTAGGFFGEQTNNPSIAIDSNDTPYVAYRSRLRGYGMIMKFDGNSWVPVGVNGYFSYPNTANNASLVIDSDDIPYIAYQDVLNQDIGRKRNATVVKYEIAPDTDGDNIQDPIDQCPTIPGLQQFNGCPDTDNDGIEDRYDQCKTSAGTQEFKGCPAGLRISVQEIDASVPKVINQKDYPLITKIFNADSSCVTMIGAQPENYSRIFTECAAEVTKRETYSYMDANNKPRNYTGDLVTFNITTGNKLVIVQSEPNYDPNTREATYGYMGFDLPNMLADQSRDVGFNVVPGQDAFVQTSIFTKNSKGIRQSERRAQVIKGSELQIFQPDYVLRNGTEEIYPFLFISDSDWNVDVCLEVPEGYVVANGECTQTFISNEIKVIEFKVADIGSPEKFDATAKFNVTHKGKKTKVDLKVKSINKKAGQKKAK